MWTNLDFTEQLDFKIIKHLLLTIMLFLYTEFPYVTSWEFDG